MMMENFMNGYPGRECQIRQALLEVLGKEKCEYFFDKFLEYFFTEKDAQFLASLGFNSLRLPLNYHHFEDDMDPMVIKEEGFKHVDRVIELVLTHTSQHSNSPLADNCIVCEIQHIHYHRPSRCPRWPIPGLALRQCHRVRGVLGPQALSRPGCESVGAHRHQISIKYLGCRLQSFERACRQTMDPTPLIL